MESYKEKLQERLKNVTQSLETENKLYEDGLIMIMGKDGTKHPVNGKINPSIQRQAWMLYRSLPDHKLSLKDIFRFSFTGVRRELILYLVISMAIAFLGMFLPKMTQIFYDQLIPQARKSQMIGITMEEQCVGAGEKGRLLEKRGI